MRYYSRPNRKGKAPWNKNKTLFPKIQKCDFCGREFLTSPTQRKRHSQGKKISCSKLCQNKLVALFMTKPFNTKCEFCGKYIKRTPDHLRKSKHIYCSKQCQGKAKHYANGKDVKCAYCGKNIKRSNFRLSKIKQHFCSAECQYKLIKPPLMNGVNHPRWLGGFNRRGYPREEWNNTLKLSIRQRDNFKCKICGVPEEECFTKLDIHHIDYDKNNNNPNNLIALCHSCHSKTGSKRDYWIKELSVLA